VLQKSYYGKVKMIYIDPPYNTGNDFVYDDNFTEPLEDYLRRTGQIDGEGRPLTTNKKSDGRFHSKWLSMMYPRLRLARELLRDDGVIFVSIDDNEVQHLRMLMNEVFGEECFIASLIWNTEGHTDNQYHVKINHEYILLYEKLSQKSKLGSVIDPNTRAESNLWKGYAENSITKNGPKNPPSEIELPIGFPCNSKSLDLSPTVVDARFYDEIEIKGFISRQITEKYYVSYPIRKDWMKVSESRLTKSCKVYSGWANADKLKAFIDNGCQPIQEEDGITKFFLSENGVIYYRKERDKAKNILSVLQNLGTTEKMRSELEKEYGIPFQYPKPKELLAYLISIGAEDGLIMDFFAGSCSTAHAVLENKNTKLKYIMVQIDQPLDINATEQKISYDFCLANKLRPVLSSISKERIRRVIKKIKAEKAQELSAADEVPDLGFKVFKLARSNFKPWKEYHGDDIATVESLFEEAVTPLAEEWKKHPDALFTEILLLEGYPLDSSVKPRAEFTANRIREVSCPQHEKRLLVCLDDAIAPETVSALQLSADEIFVCLDSAIDDSTKARLDDKGMIKTI
ncbi:MAG TPA: site-specific DNA-methyltransferase, partial [bacterium]|nr:site-specific DNA-methyltransferase [bacterium]